MRTLDREELAWAAGFFDGEGTAVLAGANSSRRHPISGRRRDYPTPALAVTQHYDPETIHRFHDAVLRLGTVSGPHSSKGTANHPRWSWSSRRPHETIAVVGLLWRFLSGPKRQQIAGVMSAYLVDAQTRRPYRHLNP
jgi:hypothetical protein